VRSALGLKTILVAEDSADTRTVLCHTPAYRGYRVLEAVNGKAAVELAREMCPDLVAMDLNMPVMDGLTATERIRQFKYECGDIPIVVVTAFDTYGMREAAQEAGCNAYLLKPLLLDELESIVERLLVE
jgi:two-component system, cell cycle response regulator DivK